MEGPRAARVEEVLGLFDFEAYGGEGRIDYILGAEPGGGVYVVGHCDDPLQARYMDYYKMGEGPYYLFYRPYHLCHIETPRAIARAALHDRGVMIPGKERPTEVFAYAKRDLAEGEKVRHAIGGAEFYGLVETREGASAAAQVPIALLEAEAGRLPVVRRPLVKDAPLTWDDIDIPESYLTTLAAEQARL